MTKSYSFHAIFENKSLNKALAIFQNILDKKTAAGNEHFTETKISLSSDSNIAIFSGVNSTITGIKECEAIILASGQIIINAHMFYDIVKKITAPEIEVFREIINKKNVATEANSKKENKSDMLTIKADKLTCRIPLQSEDKIPEITTNNFISHCVISNKNLSALLETALFIIPNSDPRPYLCGGKLLKENSKLEVAGTDCHRLAVSSIDLIVSDNERAEVIIPKKTLQEIHRQIKEDLDGETTISFSPHKVGFFLDNCRTVIASKLIQGKFPDYRTILEEEHHSYVTISTKFFTDAIERSLIILDDKSSKAILITLDKDKITIEAQSDNKGDIQEIIENCTIKYLNTEKRCSNIVVNAHYLLEILKNLKSENTTLCLNESSRPILIKDIDNQNKHYYLMPMVGL